MSTTILAQPAHEALRQPVLDPSYAAALELEPPVKDTAVFGVDWISSNCGDEHYFSSFHPRKAAVPESAVTFLDDNVLRCLPEGSKLVSIAPTGFSQCARTLKFTTTDASGTRHTYFMKVQEGEHGYKVSRDEFLMTCEMHSQAPELIHAPLGYGTYASDPQLHFFVTQFRRLARGIPHPKKLAAAVAALHSRSEADSLSTGRTLFGCTGTPDNRAYAGFVWKECVPSTSWLEAFTNEMRPLIEAEGRVHQFVPDAEPHSGMDSADGTEEMARLTTVILEKVIPRLIGPLESDGRKVIPALMHGDLWDGNTGCDLDTGEPLLFDSLNIWAHREYEFAPWLCPRHVLSENNIMLEEYMKYYTPAEPAEDFPDRLQLYHVRFNLVSSWGRPDMLLFREITKETMRELVAKYGES